MTAGRTDNSLRTARSLGSLVNTSRSQRNLLNQTDTQDYFRFNLTGSSSVNLLLTRLTANADVQLLNARGRLLRASSNSGNRPERIEAALDAGTYYARVFRRSGNTSYTLTLSAQTIAAPSPTPSPAVPPSPAPTPSPGTAPTPSPTPTPAPVPAPTLTSRVTREWIRQIPTDNPVMATAAYNYSGDLTIDSFGNTFISGYATSGIAGGANAGFFDAWFAKYDNSGNQLWIRRIATDRNDYIRGLATDSAGNLYVVGQTAGLPQNGVNQAVAFVAKYDTNGNQLWMNNNLSAYFGDIPSATDVAIDRAGRVYVTGTTFGSLGGQNLGFVREDPWIAQYDGNGNRTWIRQLGTAGRDTSTSIAIDSLGNAYIGGTTEGNLGGSSAGGSGDAWFAKYDANGNQQWVRQFGTSAIIDESVTGIAVDGTDNIYLTGNTGGAAAQLWTQNAPWLVKYTPNGDRLWSTQFGTFVTTSTDLAVDRQNNVYPSGSTQDAFGAASDGGSWDAYFAKFDSNGVNLWGEVLGTTTEDRAGAVAIDSANNLYAFGITGGSLGRTNPREPVWDVWVAKYRPVP